MSMAETMGFTRPMRRSGINRNRYLLGECAKGDLPFCIHRYPEPPAKLHSHDCFEVFFVLKGRMLLLQDGEAPVPLQAGSCSLIHPYERHGFDVPGAQPIIVNIMFSSDFLPGSNGHPKPHGVARPFPGNAVRGEGGEAGFLTPFFLHPRVHHFTGESRLRLGHCLRELLDEYQARRSARTRILQALLVTLLGLLERKALSQAQSPIHRNQRDARWRHITAVLLHLDQHFAEPLRISELARAADLNASYLSDLFTQLVGLPPKQYLIRKRIHYARHLLEQSNHSVTEIAGRAGFGDLGHFERSFHKLTGQSPSQLRRVAMRQA